MAVCKECGEEVDSVVALKVAGKVKKICEDCADRMREEAEVHEAAQGVVRGMMEYKSRG